EKYCQRYTGEAPARAYVYHPRACMEIAEYSYSQRMQYVFLVQRVNILAGNEVDFLVPLAVEAIDRPELFFLFGGKVAEIFEDYVHCCLFFQSMYGKKAKL